jgi:Histidine kinase-, DNA gyrase B-, and HSP90-like ATPase
MKHKRKYTADGRIVNDHLCQNKTTFDAFCELVNNSLQATAKNIRISIHEPSTPVPTFAFDGIIIEDDGYGVPISEINDKLLRIATNVKVGGGGIGRFGALQIGKDIRIETVAYDEKQKAYTKVILPLIIPKGELQEADVETEEVVLQGKNHAPYYKVIIKDLYSPDEIKHHRKRKIDSRFRQMQFPQAIFERYATQIFTRKIAFIINDKIIDPKDFVAEEPTQNKATYTDKLGHEHGMDFDYFKIKSDRSDIKVFIKNEQDGVLETLTYSAKHLDPNIGTWFIYVSSDREVFPPDFSSHWDIEGINEEVRHLQSFMQQEIDSFFKSINEKYENFTQRLVQDESYPFAHVKPSSEAQRLVFNQLAYLLEEDFELLKETKNSRLRKLIYPLVERSLALGAFQPIPSLSEERVTQFSNLLGKTELSDIIVFSDNVASKLQFLDFLHEITLGNTAKYLKERSQLHKVIERNLWIFGEQYAYTPPFLLSDKNLARNLENLSEKHLAFKLSKANNTLIEEIDKIRELRGITDLFFFNEKIRDDGKKEIMIIELKAPRVRIGNSELQQIDDYAFAIEEQSLFPASDVAYKLIVISSEVTKQVQSKLKTAKEKYPTEPYKFDEKTGKDISCM